MPFSMLEWTIFVSFYIGVKLTDIMELWRSELVLLLHAVGPRVEPGHRHKVFFACSRAVLGY